MISLRSVHIEEFRGIRDLTLTLDLKNFGICGPNGTGKSGVVDAVEFCLTGDVTRLSGAGSADLSVKAHAPHVDRQKEPERAKVTVLAHAHALNTDVTIVRSVKQPKKASITPSTPQTHALLETLQTHPEFALSRREIVKYVITPAGDRSKDVQTLLRLDHLEKIRKPLTTFANSERRAAEDAKRQKQTAESSLCNALELAGLDRNQVLAKINEKRQLLGLEPIPELRPDTSFKQGMLEEADEARVLRKAPALADLVALQTTIASGEPEEVAAHRQSAISAFNKLAEDTQLLTLARQHQLVATGLDLVSTDACPLCDTAWDKDELCQHLRAKLLTGDEVRKLLEMLRRDVDAIRTQLDSRRSALKRLKQTCEALDPPLTTDVLNSAAKNLDHIDAQLQAFSEDSAAHAQGFAAAQADWWIPPQQLSTLIAECFKRVSELPDHSEKNAARDVLSVAQERYEKLLEASRACKSTAHRAAVAQQVLQQYLDSCDGVLESIYDTVASDFTDFYRIINHDDEAAFQGKLSPAPAKLNFDVDFYGRGLYPPGAYHSEGHQDGMGLCLYLALMKHTLGDDFTFSVLDDVLMSVDAGHRRDVCRLLTTRFPNTQFIITTHDKVWLQYMKTERLISNSQMFGSWSVDSGPRVWDDRDVWSDINARLDCGDVEGASSLLRRYLEYIATVIADGLRAQVDFRGDGQYDLGSLLSPALARWVRLLQKAEKSAKQWQQSEREAELRERRERDKALIAATNVERWAINPAVHFNAWANFQPSEFKDVASAFKAILDELQCQHCHSFFYVVPYTGPPEEIKCNCGEVTINLKEKS